MSKDPPKWQGNLKAAAESDDPVQALTALRDRLAGDLDQVTDLEKMGYLVPQLSSQLQAVVKTLVEVKIKLKEEQRREEGANERGSDGEPGSADGRPAAERWADRVGSADAVKTS